MTQARPLLLAIDQGTTSTRATAFSLELEPLATVARPLGIVHPRPGWAEQDPTEILASVVDVVAEVVGASGGVERFAAAGLANQGETVVAWTDDKGPGGGAALAPAVLWSCGRSRPIVERLAAAGHEATVHRQTGLPLDAYFSAGKMTWLLENVPAVADAAASGRLRVGTVDAWLTDRLGETALTDPSTASRTQLYDLDERRWSLELLSLFDVPPAALPRVVPSAGSLGELRHETWQGAVPLRAMACDQQAALAGHGGFAAGALKATYGTGVFVVANAGPERRDVPGIETSIAWSLPGEPPPYVLQGGTLAAGSLLGWLASGLGLFDDPAESETLASSVPDTAGVRVLPAMGSVGAPWWRPDTGGVIAGISAAADRRHVVRAALDGIAQRVCDIVEAMAGGLEAVPSELRVDGGLTANGYLMQRQADLLGLPVTVAADAEATSRGVAVLAGIGAGLLGPDAASGPAGRTYRPALADAHRRAQRAEWRRFLEQAAALGPLGAGAG